MLSRGQLQIQGWSSLRSYAPMAVLIAMVTLPLAGFAPVASATDWSSPIDVYPGTFGDALFPKLVARPDGKPWVLWDGLDPIQGDDEIFWSQWDGASWASPGLLNRPDAISQLPVRVSSSRDGGAWTFWKEPDPLHFGGYVGLTSRWLGGSWSIPDTLWRNGGRYEAMNVVAASLTDAWFTREAGSTVVVYHDIDGQIMTSRQFIDQSHQLRGPSITLDGLGTLWVVWYQVDLSDPGAALLQFSRFTDGVWIEPQSIQNPTAPIVPKIVSDSTGTPWIVTLANAPYLGSLMTELWALKWLGNTWSAPIRVSDPNITRGYLQYQAAVSDEPGNNPVVVWIYEHPPGTTRADILISRLVGNTWTPPALVGDLADSAVVTSPDVSVQDSTIWVTYNRGLGKPYIQHVFALHSVPNAFLGSVTFSLRALSPGVQLSWSSDGDHEILSLRIRRIAPGESTPSTIAELKGQRSRAGTFLDKNVLGAGQYVYWMDFLFSNSETLSVGPRSIALSSLGVHWATLGTILDSAVVESAAGEISVRGSAGAMAKGQQELLVFDVRGRLVRSLRFIVTPGSKFRVTWDGRTQGGENAPSGMYLVRLASSRGGLQEALKVVLLR